MKDKLLARRQQAEDRFNELVKQKDEKEQEVTDINTELVKLQGEARVIDELLNKSKVSPKAEVVDVDAALEEK